jgi:hypothetical protein
VKVLARSEAGLARAIFGNEMKQTRLSGHRTRFWLYIDLSLTRSSRIPKSVAELRANLSIYCSR